MISRLGLAAALALGLVALPAAAQAATHTRPCQGSGQRCTATFPLKGTHTGDRLVVELPDTDMALRSIVPSSPSLTAAYGFGGFTTSLGGSLLTARLLRSGPAPASATIALTFFVPPAMRSCGNARFSIDGTPVTVSDVEAHGVSCAAARRAARQCVSGTGPGTPAWTIFQVDDTVSLQSRARRVTFAPGKAGATCVPVG